MTLKINTLLATAIIAGVLILAFALFRGCRQSKLEVAAKEKAQIIADSTLKVLIAYKTTSDSSKKQFQDTIEFERGQYALIEAQKERTEVEMAKISRQNTDLLTKHKLAQYADTTAILAPKEYWDDCENCFTNLEATNNLNNRYKNDINKLQDSWDKQNQLYQKRFKQLDEEKLGFYNKINTLAKEQQKVIDKLKPHGRLYLSWGVLWSPLPVAGGAGLLYQNKYNLLYGVKWYYGKYGQMVETTLNFPLSLKFK